MAMTVLFRTLRDFLFFVAFQALRVLFAVLASVKWRLNGTAQQLRQNKEPGRYATSAHRRKILFHHRMNSLFAPKMSDYILTHNGFVSPEYVLRDNVHLMFFTEKDAVFVELMEGAKGPEEYTFTMSGYTNSAMYLITMPLDSFTRLAETMESVNGQLVILQHQARAGSTLCAGIFKASGRCFVLSEPPAINSPCFLHYVERKWSRQTTISVFRASVKLLFKPRKSRPSSPLVYVLKPTSYSVICTDLIKEALPDARHFFLYREPVQATRSVCRVMEATTVYNLMFRLAHLPDMAAAILRFMGRCDLAFRNWKSKRSSIFEVGFRRSASCIMYYLQYRELGIEIHGISYELLVKHKTEMVEMIFQISGLPSTLVAKAVSAFDHDAQAGTPLARSALQKVMREPPSITPDVEEVLEEMSRELGVPEPRCWNEGFLLPGTIGAEL